MGESNKRLTGLWKLKEVDAAQNTLNNAAQCLLVCVSLCFGKLLIISAGFGTHTQTGTLILRCVYAMAAGARRVHEFPFPAALSVDSLIVRLAPTPTAKAESHFDR